LKVYTYKDPELLMENIKAEHIHRAEEMEIYSFAWLFSSA